MQALEAGARALLERRMIDRLSRRAVEPARVPAFVRRGLELAAARAIFAERAVEQFLDLMEALGDDFEPALAHEELAAIFAEPALSDESRMALVYVETTGALPSA